MNREESPIVFTIIRRDDGLTIYTKDPRGKHLKADASNFELIRYMSAISLELNERGYAVLFEVD